MAVAASVAGRAVWESVTAQDGGEPALPPPQEVLDQEAAAEKFAGELLGIFVAPPGWPVPEKFVTYEDVCGSAFSEQVPWEQAGEFALDFVLPEGFRLDPNSLNTGVIACGGTPYAARWDYSFVQPNGYPGYLNVARSLLKHEEIEASRGRVQTTEIGGRQAIYIKPLTETGIGSMAEIIFPGDRIKTSIQSSGVPERDLLAAAEAVAAALNESER